MVFSIAAPAPRSLAVEGPHSTEPEPIHQWLDEVRAQREIRQQHRRARKEVRQRRRQWLEPWGATRQQVREQTIRRRREAFLEYEAFLEHIERDREAFRNQVPWEFQQGPPWQNPLPESSEIRLPMPADEATGIYGQTAPRTSTYPLPDWDNGWYYRGF